MRRRLQILLVLTLAATTMTAAPTAAAAQEGTPTTTEQAPTIGVQPHIVGGEFADPDEYPFAAALITSGNERTQGFSCGASVLSRSWVLTAAHCMLDTRYQYPNATYGPYVAPSHYDVLTGTADLSSGGQRLAVAAVHVHPDYDPWFSDNDVALLRLARPTAAPEVTVIGSSPSELALDDPGTPAVVVGWGTTSSGTSAASVWLREVGVPVVSDQSCATSYPIGFTDDFGTPLEYHASNMICAGLPEGGKDSCQGDSGGPLLVASGGTWRQIGAVSFGLGCALPNYPGVYHRLTSSASWIGRTRRFGPFDPEGSAYITRQHRDFLGRNPTPAELTRWQATLASSPASTIIVALQASTAWDANAGMNTRLYRAAFLRNPESGGLDYWVRQRWAGRGPVSIANHFTASSEFEAAYGTLDDQAFISLLYQNIFERDADAGGRAYWTKKLASGVGRGQMLYELSNSSEYRRDTATLVRIITTRFGLLRQAPTASEITSSEALTQRSLVDLLRTSYRYATRFTG